MSDTHPSQPAGALAPVNPPGAMIPVPMDLSAILQLPNHWTSLDMSNESHRTLFGKMLDFGSDSFDSALNRSIEIEHIGVIAKPHVNPDTGEMTTRYSTLLVTPNGELFGGQSNGVRNSIAALLCIYGPPPWSPPVVVDFVQVGLPEGRRTFRLSNPRRAAAAAPSKSSGKKS